MVDLLIRNARIVDGSGAPWQRGDLAVKDGVIVAVGALSDLSAAETIDAEGLTLAPGFIDIHSHSDFSLFQYPHAESRILQGVTTEIGGNCGITTAPINPDTADLLKRYAGFLGQIELPWCSFGEYLDELAKQPLSVSFGAVVGHGTLRIAVMGFEDRKASPEEIAKLQQLTDQSMKEGAFGVSTGLIYPPGYYADEYELTEVLKAAAPYRGYYETHMRNEGDNSLASIQEAINIGRGAGVPVQIAHHKITGRRNWRVLGHATLALIERARREGLDITMDQYPYIASATSLTSLIPKWAFEGGMDVLLERLSDPDQRARIRADILENFERDLRLWSDIVVAEVPSAQNRWTHGLSIEAIAQRRQQEPIEAVFDLLKEEMGSVAQITYGMCEEDVEMIMQHPLTMIGSDGSAMSLEVAGVPHPRYYGTFTRVLGHYSRERQLFPLETAVYKMTGMPAARIGLWDRGLLRPGLRADLVLFDADKVIDTPSFADPQQPSAGIERVYVRGVLTAHGGRHTGAEAGGVLRRGRV